MATYSEVLVTESWTDIFSGAGFTAGTESVVFQNIGRNAISLSFGENEPSDTDYGVVSFTGDQLVIPISCDGLWARTAEAPLKNYVVLESADNLNLNTTLPADIYTNNIPNVRRLSVDSQPTSFEENSQFRFIDTFSDVATTNGVLYLFELAAPIVVFDRLISLYTGGRQYAVYPYDDADTYTGTQDTLSRVPLPLNGLLRDGLTTHPATNTTVTRYTVTAFTPTNAFTALDQVISPTGGTIKEANHYSSEGIKFGTPEATDSDPIKYWVYFSNLESTDETNGFWSLSWEERT